ncbi:peptidoglycan-binding protein [Bradyrhizobium sp. LCT2]|nr:peptidoglycan-binding protein [Bradyrhizobium sp. LCT2]
MLQKATWITTLASVLLCSTGSVHAIDGPSFDCSHGVNTALAIILCSNSDAASADWNMSSAFWAAFKSDRDETEQNAFNQSVSWRCGLPPQPSQLDRFYGFPPPPAQPITQAHVNCVISAFNARTAILRARLRRDALLESKLTPEEHIEIQQALIIKGFLRNRVQKYRANPDGQFGLNTRAAIRDYQRSIGASPTGFLSDQQRVAVLQSPEEMEAREARAAAEAKAKRAAIDAKKQAEEQAKRAEEQAKQEAEEREKKRLEEEAARAAEWRQKIDEAQRKGPEYAAKLSDVKWTLREHINPMTEEMEYTVLSRQSNGTGAVANVEGFCERNQVPFQATLENDHDPAASLGFITSRFDNGIIGKKRINDGPVEPTSFPAEKWRNRITVASLIFTHDGPEVAETTWRVLAEIETSRGTLYIKIPMFNGNVQKLIANCQHRYEVEKRRGGHPDAPMSQPM